MLYILADPSRDCRVKIPQHYGGSGIWRKRIKGIASLSPSRAQKPQQSQEHPYSKKLAG